MAENLGTLNFDVTVTVDKASAAISSIKDMIDGMNKDGLKLSVSQTAKDDLENVRKQLLAIQSAAQSIDIKTSGVQEVQIKSFTADNAAIEAIAKRIADAISAETLKFSKVDTTALTAELAKAIEKSVTMSKGTLMDRLKEALNAGAKKIRVDVDPKSIIKSVESALNSRKVTIDGVKVMKGELSKSIRDALKDEVFYIKVAVDKNSINSTTQAGDAANHVSKGFNKAGESAEKFRGYMKPLDAKMRTTTQLATLLGNVTGNMFSTYAIKNFLEGIVKIGGELEKQRLALSAIIGDAQKANKIFAQVSELSMISPFDVQDLITYTKQLSAFGIQYDKLYDTTKRLSDLAAGVGVSFGRIAYEFGQTSARGWLDGRELRKRKFATAA